MKKIIIFSISIALLISIFLFTAVQAVTETISGSTGGVSYEGEKTVLYLQGGVYGDVESTAASTMGRLGISWWTFDQKCQNDQWAFYYNVGGEVNTNSTYYRRAMFKGSSEECYAKYGVFPEYTRSTGNHEFNMGTPVYRFLEAIIP